VNKLGYKKGFTLIELLVVISIISLLSTVILASLNDARDKTKDKALFESAIQLRNALELYKEDHGGLYPGEPNSSFWVVKQNINGVPYYDGGMEANLSYAQLTSMLSPYLSGNILNPIHPNGRYLYLQNQATRCVGQNKIPRYVISFKPKKTSNVGLPLREGLWLGVWSPSISGEVCLTSPE